MASSLPLTEAKFKLLFNYIYNSVGGRSASSPPDAIIAAGKIESDIFTLWRKMEDPFNKDVPVFRWKELLDVLEAKVNEQLHIQQQYSGAAGSTAPNHPQQNSLSNNNNLQRGGTTTNITATTANNDNSSAAKPPPLLLSSTSSSSTSTSNFAGAGAGAAAVGSGGFFGLFRSGAGSSKNNNNNNNNSGSNASSQPSSSTGAVSASNSTINLALPDVQFQKNAIRLLRMRLSIVEIIFNSLYAGPVFPLHPFPLEMSSTFEIFFERLRQELLPPHPSPATTSSPFPHQLTQQQQQQQLPQPQHQQSPTPPLSTDVPPPLPPPPSAHSLFVSTVPQYHWTTLATTPAALAMSPRNGNNQKQPLGANLQGVDGLEFLYKEAFSSIPNNNINNNNNNKSSRDNRSQPQQQIQSYQALFDLRLALTVQLIESSRRLHEATVRLDSFAFVELFARTVTVRAIIISRIQEMMTPVLLTQPNFVSANNSNNSNNSGPSNDMLPSPNESTTTMTTVMVNLDDPLKIFKNCKLVSFALKLSANVLSQGYLTFFDELGCIVSMLCQDIQRPGGLSHHPQPQQQQPQQQQEQQQPQQHQQQQQRSSTQSKSLQMSKTASNESGGIISRLFGFLGGGSKSSSNTEQQQQQQQRQSPSTKSTLSAAVRAAPGNAAGMNQTLNSSTKAASATAPAAAPSRFSNQDHDSTVATSVTSATTNQSTNEVAALKKNSNLDDRNNANGSANQRGGKKSSDVDQKEGSVGTEGTTASSATTAAAAAAAAGRTSATASGADVAASCGDNNSNSKIEKVYPQSFHGSHLLQVFGNDIMRQSIHHILFHSKVTVPVPPGSATIQAHGFTNAGSSLADPHSIQQQQQQQQQQPTAMTVPIHCVFLVFHRNRSASSSTNYLSSALGTTTNSGSDTNPSHSSLHHQVAAGSTTVNTPSSSTSVLPLFNNDPTSSTNFGTGVRFCRDSAPTRQQQGNPPTLTPATTVHPSNAVPKQQLQQSFFSNGHHQRHFGLRAFLYGPNLYRALPQLQQKSSSTSTRGVVANATQTPDVGASSSPCFYVPPPLLSPDERQQILDFVTPIVESGSVLAGQLSVRETPSFLAVARGERDNPNYCFAVVARCWNPASELPLKSQQMFLNKDLADRLNKFIRIWNRTESLTDMYVTFNDLRSHCTLNNLFN